MSSRSSGGDPARTLALLWRQPGSGRAGRGPKQGSSVEDVIATAIGLADTGGLDAVSLRTVARALGISPMAIYTYVPGKAELLDAMLDAIYHQMPRPDLHHLPWRDRVRNVADANRDLYLAHPWLAEVSTARPPLGPGLMAKYEHELSAFDGLGLDDVAVDDALTYLLTFVQAAARAAVEAAVSRLASAMNDQQWWAANAPLLERVFDPTAYPTAARVGSAAGAARGSAYDPEHAYTYGLDRTLDGLATQLASAGP